MAGQRCRKIHAGNKSTRAEKSFWWSLLDKSFWWTDDTMAPMRWLEPIICVCDSFARRSSLSLSLNLPARAFIILIFFFCLHHAYTRTTES